MCDQCNALTINGIFCHELGCPNIKKCAWCDKKIEKNEYEEFNGICEECYEDFHCIGD